MQKILTKPNCNQPCKYPLQSTYQVENALGVEGRGAGKTRQRRGNEILWNYLYNNKLWMRIIHKWKKNDRDCDQIPLRGSNIIFNKDYLGFDWYNNCFGMEHLIPFSIKLDYWIYKKNYQKATFDNFLLRYRLLHVKDYYRDHSVER